ncbi:hypothetical protein SBOR_3419 [Sclerotinia borealis F-4128]|uniref:Uncharacterized protein n=1 Tax=Sclerotinia borealis (strain F-4128) TaxID=1432307 RepID=W9CJL7_SCLBF|nr:hypothetical protein SBOR_3419 [Sclerotinia borealis F-4128]
MSLQSLPRTLSVATERYFTPLPSYSESAYESSEAYLEDGRRHVNLEEPARELDLYDEIFLCSRRNFVVGGLLIIETTYEIPADLDAQTDIEQEVETSGAVTAIPNPRVQTDNGDATNNGFIANNKLPTPEEFLECRENVDDRIDSTIEYLRCLISTGQFFNTQQVSALSEFDPLSSIILNSYAGNEVLDSPCEVYDIARELSSSHQRCNWYTKLKIHDEGLDTAAA